LDISPLFFYILSTLVQTPIIIYDEILQNLAVEGDITLLKPFMDPTPPTVQPRIGTLGHTRVWQNEKKTSPRPANSDNTIKAEVQKPFCTHGHDTVSIPFIIMEHKFGLMLKHHNKRWRGSGNKATHILDH
jgi:hypothetical protein